MILRTSSRGPEAYRLPMGRHAGRTLAQIAETDAGLLYLDRLQGQDGLDPEVREAVESYLAVELVQGELIAALEREFMFVLEGD